MASIRDVAKYAKVAPSTVSLVLNNTGYVSDCTREKVLNAMDVLNYTPNELARNFSKKRTNIVGVIMPDIIHPFFCTFVKYVEQHLYKRGYKTMICSTSLSRNAEEEYLEMLKRHTMDGIIMNADEVLVRQYADIHRPIVSLDLFLGDDIPIVMTDHEQEGRLAASLFCRNGCKFVVQTMGDTSVKTPAHERNFVLNRVLKERGVQTECIEMGFDLFEIENLDRLANRVFEEFPQTDGIFGSEIFISRCLQQARRRGIRVPEDLKLIACDGTYLSEVNQITAIMQPIDELAKCSTDLILDMIKNKQVTAERPALKASVLKGNTTVV